MAGTPSFESSLYTFEIVSTLDEEEDPLELAAGERVRLDRVMIEPNGLS
ncbi:hypothetical protein H5410_045338 [Solanum commersonii]|uniref:Uncharacterized protein n=1 Tax=Solanum commersonii TaxID=4109 RepID=A0A9J5XDD9_SOLCO|nr:hypothetical protein H5410_045338 [Solanum commersonii]